MSQPMISVEHLSKAYRLGMKEEIPDTFVGAFTGWLKAPLRNWKRLQSLNTFNEPVAGPAVAEEEEPSANGNGQPDDILWALRDVSFEVNEGEVVGIIGRNGAGKSTLLKILSRITEPTHGRAVIRGRVSSLLEVGTGFHPELTGRENIYMNGTILGMRKKEIDKKFDEIVDFSGVEKFLDTPIKRYSSGMNVRLAFAVAAHLEPEILIIDEVLAVGDMGFQKRCIGKMQDVASSGRTVLFVSHNMPVVEALCCRGILMAAGSVQEDGPIRRIIDSYRNEMLNIGDEVSAARGFDDAFFKSARLLNDRGEPTTYIPLGRDFRLVMEVFPQNAIVSPRIGVGIDDVVGNRMLTVHTPLSDDSVGRLDGHCEVECRIRAFPLAPGHYKIKLAAASSGETLGIVDEALSFAVIDGELFKEGQGHHRGVCVAPSSWRAIPVSCSVSSNVAEVSK